MKNKTLPQALLLLATVGLLAAPGLGVSATRPLHFGLARSVPADKATVHQVPEIKLWFTEAPADGSVSIRLLDAGGEPVATTAPTRDAEDPKAFALRPSTAPAPGSYTVSWRGMGADGHVVRGGFGFTVAAH